MNTPSTSISSSVLTAQSALGPRRQRGAMWGNLLVFGVLILIAVIGIRLMPVYIDSMSIKEGLNSVLDQDLASLKKAEIRAMLTKRFDVSAVQAVNYTNFNDVVTIDKKKGKVRINVKYSVERPLIGNVKLVVDFDHEVEK